MKISEGDIRNMVESCVRTLNEISMRDAYQRFYNGKVPEKVFEALMQGAELMTPFHKFILDEYVKRNIGGDVVISAGNLWANATNEARQYLVNAIKDDKESYTGNEWKIKHLIKIVGEMKSHTEKSFGDRGLEVLLKTNEVLITCTKSYTASHHYYGDSHWCTASDIFGEFNGFEMFSRYAAENGEILVQFIDLTNKETNSFQVGYSIYREPYAEEVFDWSDEQRDEEAVAAMLRAHGIDYQKFIKENLAPIAKRLSNETIENLHDENDYYTRKSRVRARKVFSKVERSFNSKDFISGALGAMKECIESKLPKSFGPGECYWMTDVNTFNEDGRPTGNKVSIVSVDYNGYDEQEKSAIKTFTDADFNSDYELYISAVTQTWLIDRNFNLIGKYQGCYGGVKDNIISIKNDFDWGDDISLVNIVDGRVVATKFEEIEMRRSDHVIEVWINGDDAWLMSSITGKKIPGRPRV